MLTPALLGRALRLVSSNIHNGAKRSSFLHQCLYTPRDHSVKLGWQASRMVSDISISRPLETQPEKRERELMIATIANYAYWQTTKNDPKSNVLFRKFTSVGKASVVSRTWLRDACTCPHCVDPSSGQKRFATTDLLSETLNINDLRVNDKGLLEIVWANDFFTQDDHVSEYDTDIWEHTTQPRPKATHVLWTKETLETKPPFFYYDSFMEDGEGYRDALRTLYDYGIIFVRGVPLSEDSVEKLGERVGRLSPTFYGTTWDVISKPDAENVAYTSGCLPLHQDLLYMDNVPHLQLLHCFENSCEGGESIFSDGKLAAYRFRQKHGPLAMDLYNNQVMFHYNKGGHRYMRSHKTLMRDGINWSPLFQHPIQPRSLTAKSMLEHYKWLNASRKLQDIFEAPHYVYEYKMQPGDCVIFSNRRVLHGRRAFDTTSGNRRLKGGYVDVSSFKSVIRSKLDQNAFALGEWGQGNPED